MLNNAGLFIGLIIILDLIASCLEISDPLSNSAPRSIEFGQVSGSISPNDLSNVDRGAKYDDCPKKRRKRSEFEDDTTETEDKDESSEPPQQTSTESAKSAVATGKSGREGVKIWDQWGNWSSCSVTCGIGTSERWRHCIGGGCVPGEKKAQFRTCTFAAC